MTNLPLIRPLAGLVPRTEHAAAVAAPPYDVLSADEARSIAGGNPLSFLHISRAEIDLPAGTDPYAPDVYRRSAENFGRMISDGILLRDAAPSYYAYRLSKDSLTQTGLVVAASVAEYDRGRIRRHELTRPDKENDRVRQIEALNAQTGPALLAHPDSDEAERLARAVATGAPIADFTADDGVRHTLWRAQDASTIARITQAFDAMPALYIADGHHRSAAASRVAAARRNKSAPESAESFLAVVFPARQMRILDYNRVVRDLNGLSADAFLKAIGQLGDVAPIPQAARPERKGVFSLYLAGQWYRIALDAERIPAADPVRRLDVSLLSDQILSPILGILDPRRDTRIDFVGGIRGLAELERRVDGGGMAAAFALYPTSLAELMSVADAGQMMPPKSTWFEPKLADGLVSHVLD